MERLPTWRQILRHDYYSGVAAYFAAWTPALLISGPIIGCFKFERMITLGEFVYIETASAAMALFCWLMAWLRLRKLMRICELGQTIQGKVVANYWAEQRGIRPGKVPLKGGMLIFEYTAAGELRQSWISLWRNAVTEAVDAGDPIRLVVDERDPDFALPIDLFLSEGR